MSANTLEVTVIPIPSNRAIYFSRDDPFRSTVSSVKESVTFFQHQLWGIM